MFVFEWSQLFLGQWVIDVSCYSFERSETSQCDVGNLTRARWGRNNYESWLQSEQASSDIASSYRSEQFIKWGSVVQLCRCADTTTGPSPCTRTAENASSRLRNFS
jgi:hypothetical protein